MYWSKRYQQQWVKPNKNMWTSQQLAMWLLREMSSRPHVVKMCTVRWGGLFKYQLSLDQTLASLENCMLRKKHQNAAQFKGSAKGKLSSPANVARCIFRCFLKFYTKDNHPEFNPFAKILSSPKMTVAHDGVLEKWVPIAVVIVRFIHSKRNTAWKTSERRGSAGVRVNKKKDKAGIWIVHNSTGDGWRKNRPKWLWGEMLNKWTHSHSTTLTI